MQINKQMKVGCISKCCKGLGVQFDIICICGLIYSISIMASKAITSLKDFQFICKLGEGAFAEVFKVKRKEDGLYYAMKKIKMSRIKDKQRNNALNQIRILASESGENIIHYKQAFYDEVSVTLCVVMEYAQGGDLLKLIQSHSKKNTKIKESEIWKAMVHLAKGLKSLHDKKILHRDLKGANIFITGDGYYKIGDMNVSKVVKSDYAKTQTGTPYYASPEIWKDQPYGAKSDMWSLGCVLYQMAAHKPPFTAPDIPSLYKKVCNGAYSRIPHEYSNDLACVISSLLKVNPDDRPSASALLNNPLVEDNYDGKLGSYWQKDELLQTIKFSNRNFKQINSVLPKPKYALNQSRQRSFSQDKRTVSNINNFQEKDLVGSIMKKRIKSTFQQNPSISENNTPNILKSKERTVSSYDHSNFKCKNIPIQKSPLSQKIVKKLIQQNQTQHKMTRLIKLPPIPNSKTSRKRIETIINSHLPTDNRRGNKQNTNLFNQPY